MTCNIQHFEKTVAISQWKENRGKVQEVIKKYSYDFHAKNIECTQKFGDKVRISGFQNILLCAILRHYFLDYFLRFFNCRNSTYLPSLVLLVIMYRLLNHHCCWKIDTHIHNPWINFYPNFFHFNPSMSTIQHTFNCALSTIFFVL